MERNWFDLCDSGCLFLAFIYF